MLDTTAQLAQRFLRAANRFANASKSSSGGAGFTVSFVTSFFAGSASSVGGSSGSFGVRTPALLASAEIVAASGMGDSNTGVFSASCEMSGTSLTLDPTPVASGWMPTYLYASFASVIIILVFGLSWRRPVNPVPPGDFSEISIYQFWRRRKGA